MGNYSKLRMQIVMTIVTFADGSTITFNVPLGHVDTQVHFERDCKDDELNH